MSCFTSMHSDSPSRRTRSSGEYASIQLTCDDGIADLVRLGSINALVNLVQIPHRDRLVAGFSVPDAVVLLRKHIRSVPASRINNA